MLRPLLHQNPSDTHIDKHACLVFFFCIDTAIDQSVQLNENHASASACKIQTLTHARSMYVCTYASLLSHLRNHHRPRTPRRGPPPRRAPAPPRLPPAVPRLRSPHVQAPLAPPRPGVHQTRHRSFFQHFDDRRLIAWVCRRRRAGGLLWETAALTKLTTELESESRFTKDKNTEILRLRFQSGNGGKGGGGGKQGQVWTRAGTNFSRRTCASSSCRIPPLLTSCSDLRDSSASSSRFPPSPCSTASGSVPWSPGAAVTAAAANFYECAWGKR